MKAEIQQILKMNKDGVLTDDQAAELLAELSRKDAAPSGRSGSWAEPIHSAMNATVKHALDAAFGWDKSGAGGAGDAGGAEGYRGEAYAGGSGQAGGLLGTGGLSGNNHIHMSRFDLPAGKEHTFTGNTVRMSSVTDMRLDRAEMIDNTIDMSKASDFSVQDGKLIGCEIRASSAEDWNVEAGTVRALSVNGSRISDFRCSGGSVVRGVRVQGSSIKDFRVAENSKVAELLIHSTALAHVNVARSGISGGEIQSSHVAGLALEDCEAKDVMVRLTSFKRVDFRGCFLADAVFTGSDRWSWKRQGFKDARFENCRLEKVLFTDCRLVDVTLKNVSLKGARFRGLNLSGMVIDGNEAFLKAAGAAGEADRAG